MVTGGQPSLSPQPIVDTLTQLDEMLKKLEQAVMDVIKDIDHKKKVTDVVCIKLQIILCIFSAKHSIFKIYEEILCTLGPASHKNVVVKTGANYN